MKTIIKLLFNLISAYRKYIIVAGLALALVFGGKAYVSHVEHEAYNKGYQSSELVWDQKRTKMQTEIDSKFIENSLLSAALRARTEEKQKLIDQIDKDTAKKQAEFAASDAGKKKTIDTRFIDVYNESLGEK